MSISASGVLRPSVECSRSASQAPPVYSPTMALFGPMRGRSSAASCWQSASASGSFIEVLLEEKLRRDRIDLAFSGTGAAQPRTGLRGRMAFVYARPRQLEAALEAAGELLGAARHGVRLARPRHRQAGHQVGRLPLCHQRCDLFKARHRAERMGGAQLGLADGDSNAL